MAQNDDTQGYEENFSSILDLDRILDAIGQGKPIPQTESFDANDPVFAELANAREDLYRDIPPAPDMSHLVADDGNVAYGDFGAQEESGESTEGNSRFLRAGAKAAAAGGLSVTSMLIAGGVAAALAVGGLGYAAYSNSHDPHINRETAAKEGTAEVQSLEGSGDGVAGGRGGVTNEENLAEGDKGEREEKVSSKRSPKNEPKKTSAASSSAPKATVAEIPTTTILLGGTGTPDHGAEPAMPLGAPGPTSTVDGTTTTKSPKPTSTSSAVQSTTVPAQPKVPTLTDYTAPRVGGSDEPADK